jgi:hypothetical protein
VKPPICFRCRAEMVRLVQVNGGCLRADPTPGPNCVSASCTLQDLQAMKGGQIPEWRPPHLARLFAGIEAMCASMSDPERRRRIERNARIRAIGELVARRVCDTTARFHYHGWRDPRTGWFYPPGTEPPDRGNR